MSNNVLIKCILFDWGDTVMRDFPRYHGPMRLWPQVEAIPGVRDALDTIGRDRIIALASNAADSSESDIRQALARVGLDQFVNNIYCFSAIGSMKPSAGFFKYILSNLHLKPHNILMVGDDFEKDILGANRSGIFGIWFNERTDETRSGTLYRTIHTMSELPSLVMDYSSQRAEYRK